MFLRRATRLLPAARPDPALHASGSGVTAHAFQPHRCLPVGVEWTTAHLGRSDPPRVPASLLSTAAIVAGVRGLGVRCLFTGGVPRFHAGSTRNPRSSSSSSSAAAAAGRRDVEPNGGKEEELKVKEASSSSTSSSSSLPIMEPELEPEGGKPNKTQQLKKVFKEYGAVGVSFHIGISLMSLGMFYVLISSGINMAAVLCKLGFSEAIIRSKMAAGTSTFVLAYAVHKLFAPVRISITLVSVPLVVRYFRKTGLFKPPAP